MDTNDLIQRAIDSVSSRLHSYQASEDTKQNKQASLLSYWLYDYMRMLKKEKTFDPRKLKRYKRGEIVKVHLGYNIGSEQGGLHYAIVLDKNNSPSDQTITIVPLSSVKNNKPLHRSKVLLGDTIFFQLNEKLAKQETVVNQRLKEILAEIDSLKEYANSSTDDELLENKVQIAERLRKLYESVEYQKKLRETNIKIKKEILKMKKGSIALVGQITTVSKIRIYNPLHPIDVLSNIKVSPALLDLIDDKIREMYIGK